MGSASGTRWLRPRLPLLLASSSVAALLVGGGVPPAFATCPTSIPPPNSGCTNPAGTTITGIQVTGSVNGSITNAGKISTNGIVLTNTGTVNGAIVDSGDLTGGITLNGNASLDGGLTVNGTQFSGNISNAGSLSGPSFAILMQGIAVTSQLFFERQIRHDQFRRYHH
jgi:hypothetical protein